MRAANERTHERRLEAQVDGAPCSVNRMYRRGRGGQVYLSDAAAAWEMNVLAEVRSQTDWQAFHADWERAGCPQVAVDLKLWCVRGDADNYAKTTLDGLKNALLIDDRYFSPVSVCVAARSQSAFKRGVTVQVTLPLAPAEEGLRARDLVDPAMVERLRSAARPTPPAPVERVRVEVAERYGAVALLFPPSPLAEQGRDSEWGTFLPLEQARELRDALVAALGSGSSGSGTGVEER